MLRRAAYVLNPLTVRAVAKQKKNCVCECAWSRMSAVALLMRGMQALTRNAVAVLWATRLHFKRCALSLRACVRSQSHAAIAAHVCVCMHASLMRANAQAIGAFASTAGSLSAARGRTLLAHISTLDASHHAHTSIRLGTLVSLGISSRRPRLTSPHNDSLV